ncbi:putative transcriptional repressor [Vitreoscilla sp. C1]|uniref:transcriptional regulator n=1 Tax=Vitreoscilla sp. (strain C1) TaxID=96942 RepID=UPI000CDC4F32|nr:YdaS family helix-turn-helix protein [Vitreoscilla sp. C1]AUZ05315.1 putative transcriptional repressor [Vitreoscilla sp. C1]
MTTAINRAIEIAGSQAKLAKAIGKTKQTVHSYVKGYIQIAPSTALDIENVTGVSAADLVFEPLRKNRK